LDQAPGNGTSFNQFGVCIDVVVHGLPLTHPLARSSSCFLFGPNRKDAAQKKKKKHTKLACTHW